MENVIPIGMIVWNRFEYTKNALDAISKNTNYPYVLFIIDNNSEKNIINYLKHLKKNNFGVHCRGIYITLRKKSHGVFKNMQKIYKTINRIFKDDFKYWCKIDNDTIVPENWLKLLVNVMEKKSNLDIVQADHNMRIPKSYVNKEKWFSSLKKEKIELAQKKYNLFYNSYVGGSCIIIRNTSAIAKVMRKINCYKNVWGWTIEQRKRINNGNNIAFFDGLYFLQLDYENEQDFYNNYDYYIQTRGKK